jgi:hypothetical protein
VFIWYKPTFNTAFRRYSPGEILLGSLIEYARAEGCTFFDFARGDEAFKRRFASSTEHNVSFDWVPDGRYPSLGNVARACRRLLFPVPSVGPHPTGRAPRGSSA